MMLAIDDERGWLVVDQVLEFCSELLQRKPSGCSEFREFMRILEVISANSDHVTTGDGVSRGMNVDQPDVWTAGLGIE
jgi:hypothetical protein